MTIWAAGPVDLDLALPRPPSWPPVGDGGRGLVRVDVSRGREQLSFDASPGGPNVATHEIEVTHETDDRLTLRREVRAFEAAIDYARGEATYDGMLDLWPTGELPVFESFMRALTAGWLLRRGGALWHGSSVKTGDDAFAFVGLSGAGKTTLVASTPDDVYLSDDQTILLARDDGVFEAWATPFSGNLGRRSTHRGHAPLRALVVLSSDRPEATELTRLEPAATTAAALLRHLCCFEKTAVEGKRAFEHVFKLIEQVPVFSLRRHLDDPLEVILERLRERTEPPARRMMGSAA